LRRLGIEDERLSVLVLEDDVDRLDDLLILMRFAVDDHLHGCSASSSSTCTQLCYAHAYVRGVHRKF
jgi:hypothetical protein